MKIMLVILMLLLGMPNLYNSRIFADTAGGDGSTSVPPDDRPPDDGDDDDDDDITIIQDSYEVKVKADSKAETAPYVLTGPAVVIEEGEEEAVKVNLQKYKE